ncbi:MAG TPA: glycosyltransferase [Hanamia sp.]
MNSLFLISESLADFSGISKKILAQVNALKNQGLNVSLSYLKENGKYKFEGRYINEKIIDKYSEISIISKFQRRCTYKNLYNYIDDNDIKLVYIRYIHFANPFFISFLKKLKKKGIIVLLELPTYPYDQEYRNAHLTAKLAFLIEIFFRKKFKNYVTRIITLSHDTTIFKIPTIQISNGIDANFIDMVKKRKPDGELHLIGVATISFWDGYDRVIEGLYNYYKAGEADKKKVFFHIVGDTTNSESLRYKQMVKKYSLSNYVSFYGKKSGKELDNLFDRMDLAVGSLGCHRKAIHNIKSLKNREYCARGIPFFYSETDPDFEDKNFIYKVPANDDPINIEEIINFMLNNKFDEAKIRDYAIKNLTWDKQFEKVLREVKSGCLQ